ARHPLNERDHSRLMVVHRDSGSIEHRQFREIGDYLHPKDILVLNNTRVIPCRLIGKKIPTGGRVEVLLLRRYEADVWDVFVDGRVRMGTRIGFDDGCSCEVLGDLGFQKRVRMDYSGTWEETLSRLGRIPLPPYIAREANEEDKVRYQTVYGIREGAIAVPTAGLHFTDPLFRSLYDKGVAAAFVTLHVGPGTFLPVREEAVEKHTMEPEWYELNAGTSERIQEGRKNGGRVVAVGTTAVRVLETAAGPEGRLKPSCGETRLFIYPGYRFQWVDLLLTNFHLPRTTLLMLVTAFAGRELVLNAYREAVRLKYRFYSYGDAMLIV
ncbi:MAG: tRNA preQ1(34) S-adenosylmethionine ribosyltransferase-isomerase QueA, partial [Nitrospirae bacterium]|nr:tRNA preQ1(34) S-adenosylmethionine ribosyltransferase-isomerase QueA [Nitrospirota bacterium]